MGSTSVSAPPKRDYSTEMNQAMQAQMSIIPGMLDFEKMYMGRMQANQFLGIQGQMQNQQQGYMQGIEGMQQGASAYNQAMIPLMSQIAEGGRNAYMQSLGGGADLLNRLTQQAQTGLNAGMNPTAQENQYSQQAARAAMSARGLAGGNQGIANEVLNSYTLQQQRQDKNRQFAQQVLGLQSGVANAGYQQYGAGMNQNLAMLNPTAQYQLGSQMQAGIGAQFLNPESQMASDIKGANQANQMAANAATAANNASMIGAGVGAAATIGSKFIKPF
jgi:hypothetical protein